MNWIRTIILPISVIFLLTGCVSTVIEEEKGPPPVIIAQNSDGDVTIGWESELDLFYTVYCQKTSGGDWVILSGANRLRGTGEQMTAHDRTNPRKPPRRYRVLPEKP